MFSQKELAEAFGITPQGVTQALRGFAPQTERRTQQEGRRTVIRTVKVYSQDAAYAVAVGSKKLSQYQKLCASKGLDAPAFAVTRKETSFYFSLRRFLPAEIEIKPQYQVGRYFIDFYLPQFNLAIEYDERAHSKSSSEKKDKNRQDRIQEAIGAFFVRVSEGEEEQGLFAIARAVLER